MDWPKAPTTWLEGRTLRVSIPFTWNLSSVKSGLRQTSFFWDVAEVGGPAVELMPGYFADLPHVTEGHVCPGVLQRVNPDATRTTVGCTRRCQFCGIGTGKIEGGGLKELADWPNRPVLCDNNLLAASDAHVERVLARLIGLGEADFNQGLDARLLRPEHAEMIARIKRPVVRLALDRLAVCDEWDHAFEVLRAAGIAKRKIRSYCLVGFDSGPEEAWQRTKWVHAHGVDPLPMWFHGLDAMQQNTVTPAQEALGWNDFERRRIMQFWYQHKQAVKVGG